jgi:ABC-type lipoprotein export system ATPase subunit
MQLNLPSKIDKSQPIIDTKSLVIIGANGSGKSRFGADIEIRYQKTTHRVSAQKSLTMPNEVSPKSKKTAQNEFLYGYNYDSQDSTENNKMSNRWGRKPSTFLLDDYGKLLVLLHTEEYEEALKYKEGEISKPTTKLDRIQSIWEEVLPHRKLRKKAGIIEAYPTGNINQIYNASEMSDGERVIFYLIGEVVAAPQNALIIIDEPEIHVHKAVTKHLWDKIELERPDCTFIYLTHDIDFAASRQNSQKIWMKGYIDKSWDYEILPDNSPLPEQLYLDILGSRQPVLFIEGDTGSIDYNLLPAVFTEMNVKPLGSCGKVIDTTKTFNAQNNFHHIKSFGLIDRDRRTDDEINHINNTDIWVAEVAEVENFLLLEDVVKTVATKMMANPDDVFSKVKVNVVAFFKEQLISQVIAHTISRIERIFKTATSQKGIDDFATLDKSLSNFWGNQDFKKIYDELFAEFTQLIDTQDFEGILKVFNNKGLIAKSNVSSLCGLNSKENAYLKYIISTLKLNNESSEKIRKAIKAKIKSN